MIKPDCQDVVSGHYCEVCLSYCLSIPFTLPGFLLRRTLHSSYLLDLSQIKYYRRSGISMHLAGPLSLERDEHRSVLIHITVGGCLFWHTLRPQQFVGLQSHSLNKRQFGICMQASVPKYKFNRVIETQVSIGTRQGL